MQKQKQRNIQVIRFYKNLIKQLVFERKSAHLKRINTEVQNNKFTNTQFSGVSLIMNKEEILELIQTAVRPLRQKIEHLQRENRKLQLQLSTQHHDPQRLRSISRQKQRPPKPQQIQATRSPSIKKRDDKPIWNPTGRIKQDSATYKSPPPVDKHKVMKPVSPKIAARAQSKQKQQKQGLQKRQSIKKKEAQYLSFEKPEPQQKKIKGGQKHSESNSNKESQLKTQSIKQGINPNTKNNPEYTSANQNSSHSGSQLLPEQHEG